MEVNEDTWNEMVRVQLAANRVVIEMENFAGMRYADLIYGPSKNREESLIQEYDRALMHLYQVVRGLPDRTQEESPVVMMINLAKGLSPQDKVRLVRQIMDTPSTGG